MYVELTNNLFTNLNSIVTFSVDSTFEALTAEAVCIVFQNGNDFANNRKQFQIEFSTRFTEMKKNARALMLRFQHLFVAFIDLDEINRVQWPSGGR